MTEILLHQLKDGDSKIVVQSEAIELLLSIDPDNYIAGKTLDEQLIVSVPVSKADKIKRLEKFGYTPEEIILVDGQMNL